jgi:hypothetical protein
MPGEYWMNQIFRNESVARRADRIIAGWITNLSRYLHSAAAGGI